MPTHPLQHTVPRQNPSPRFWRGTFRPTASRHGLEKLPASWRMRGHMGRQHGGCMICTHPIRSRRSQPVDRSAASRSGRRAPCSRRSVGAAAAGVAAAGRVGLSPDQPGVDRPRACGAEQPGRLGPDRAQARELTDPDRGTDDPPSRRAAARVPDPPSCRPATGHVTASPGPATTREPRAPQWYRTGPARRG
jgi:hypothetical protein